MNRILGIDYGSKRIGIAMSDPFGWTAQPLQTLEVKSERQCFYAIRDLVCEHEVEKIIIGMPLSLNGDEGIQAQKVRVFAQALEKFLLEREPDRSVSFEFIDERLTTSSAERILIEADMSRKRRREVIDKQAAALLLQSYLDMHATPFDADEM